MDILLYMSRMADKSESESGKLEPFRNNFDYEIDYEELEQEIINSDRYSQANGDYETTDFENEQRPQKATIANHTYPLKAVSNTVEGVFAIALNVS